MEAKRSCGVFVAMETASYQETPALTLIRKGNFPPMSIGPSCTSERKTSMKAFISAASKFSQMIQNSSHPRR